MNRNELIKRMNLQFPPEWWDGVRAYAKKMREEKAVTIAEFVREVGPTVEPWEATTIDDVRRAVSDLDVYWPEQEFTKDEVADYAWMRCKERKAIYDKLEAGESRTHPGLAVYYYKDGDVYLEYVAEGEDWNKEEISRIIDLVEAELEGRA